jgi:hypothetical protein
MSEIPPGTYNSPPEISIGKKDIYTTDGSLDDDPRCGLDNGKLKEKQPKYVSAPCEKVFEGLNNTYIILGRDRNGSISSGYGSKAHTRCGAIDIVVGLQGWNPGEGGYEDPALKTWVQGYADKNFGSMNNAQPGDAARIYISQRTDVDSYFDIADGFVGKSVAESAIALKADSVRIMARKGIKLVTAKGSVGRNSLDGKLKVTTGIDLIAGNRDFPTGLETKMAHIFGQKNHSYLQPIPKGENLLEYLTKLHDNVQLLNSILAGIMMVTPYLCNAVLSPKQVLTPVGGGVSIPSFWDVWTVQNYLLSVQKQSWKLYSTRMGMFARGINYLSEPGSQYILSRNNRTN